MTNYWVYREAGKVVSASERPTPECQEGPLSDAHADIVAFFTPPPPVSVKMWQAKIALAQSGKLDAANAAIASSNNQALQLAWEYAPDLSRNSPGLAAIAQAIGLSNSEVDSLFEAAAAIAV